MCAAGQASTEDVAFLESVVYQIDGKTICAFGEACSWPTESFVAKFRDELIGSTRPENAGRIFHAETKVAAAGLQPAG